MLGLPLNHSITGPKKFLKTRTQPGPGSPWGNAALCLRWAPFAASLCIARHSTRSAFFLLGAPRDARSSGGCAVTNEIFRSVLGGPPGPNRGNLGWESKILVHWFPFGYRKLIKINYLCGYRSLRSGSFGRRRRKQQRRSGPRGPKVVQRSRDPPYGDWKRA